MKRFLPAVGLLALAVLPPAAAAQQLNMYELFRTQVLREQTRGRETDQTVIEFLQGIYRARWNLGMQEVAAAIRGEPWAACTSATAGAPQTHVVECGRALENIQLLAEEEQSLRAFGRTLQRIAVAQELPLSEIPGRPFHLATDLSGIINIWRAGTGSVQQSVSGAMLVRTRALTDGEIDEVRETYEQVANGLASEWAATGGQNEWFVGLIAYFQYGARLRTGARSPAYPPPINDGQSGVGTERQYMFHQDYANTWGTFLTALWDDLPKDPDDFDPPLSKNEVAYILFPEELTSLLPPNVLVWARVDGYEPGANHPLGDVGLAWTYPLEPMLPSLLSADTAKSGEPILGGRYPPEPATPGTSDDNGNPLPAGAKLPIDGRGLCSMALAQRGYLCRPLKATSEERCPPSQQDGENVITLVSCTLEEEPTLTVAGADVCREIEWRKGVDENAQRCTVEPGVESEYELVKIQQRCLLQTDDPYAGKSEEEQDALCCRLEGEAHLVECKAQARNGVLRGGDGNPLRVKGADVTPQVCMEIRRLASCAEALGRDVRCPSVHPLFAAADSDALDAAAAAADPDKSLRVAARIRAIERHIPVCSPGTEASYKNTIGNNACYIGQCVEESLELHRITGGRSPAVVGDGAFPYDDPDTGEALATLLRSVPATNPPLPSYRPQMVARTLEDALCQLQGLPAATPPHLCAFSPSRRLAVPLEDGAATARSLLFNVQEQREAELLTEELAAGLGSRIGTDMQGQYLRIGTRTLSEVVALANSLLRDMVTVTFPLNMCPLSL